MTDTSGSDTGASEGEACDAAALPPATRQRLAHLFGDRDAATLAALARYEALIARPGHALGFAGGLAAHWLRQRWPAETAVLDAARRAAEAAADAADPLRRQRLALEAVARSLAAEHAAAEAEVARLGARREALAGVIAALTPRSPD